MPQHTLISHVRLGAGFVSARAFFLSALALAAFPLSGRAQWTQSTFFSSGGLTPAGVAADATGNVYFVDTSTSSLKSVPSGGGSATTVVSSLSSGQGVAWAPVGSDFNLFYTQSTSVSTVANAGGAFQGPSTIAFTGAGGIAAIAPTAGADFLTAFVRSSDSKILFSAHTGGVWSSPAVIDTNALVFNAGLGVAVTPLSGGGALLAYIGPNKDEFFSVYTPGAIPAWTAPQSLGLGVASQLSAPTSLAFDSTGNLFLSDSGNNRVVEFAITGSLSGVSSSSAPTYGALTTVTSLVSNPQGLAVDGSGNVFIADLGNNRIVMESASAIPEPSTYAAFAGLAAMGAVFVRRRKIAVVG